MTKEEQGMMETAIHEIRSLRRHNEILSAKVEVFESMMQVLHTSPATRSQGMSPDIAWQMEKHLASQKEAPLQVQNQ